MAEPKPPTQSSGDSWLSWQIMWLSFQAGKDRAERKAQHKQSIDLGERTLGVANQILAAVTARPTAPASRLRYGRVKDRIKDGFAKLEVRFTVTFDTIKKLYEFWRSPWGFFLGLLAWAAASYLGLVR